MVESILSALMRASAMTRVFSLGGKLCSHEGQFFMDLVQGKCRFFHMLPKLRQECHQEYEPYW